MTNTETEGFVVVAAETVVIVGHLEIVDVLAAVIGVVDQDADQGIVRAPVEDLLPNQVQDQRIVAANVVLVQ